jgi:hypothetical protein
MNGSIALFALAVTFAAGNASAEPALAADLAPGGGQSEAQAHFGVATSPFGVTALPEAKGQAFVLIAAARYAVSKPFSFELRAPLVLGSVAQPAGSYVDAAALGNPQFGARYRIMERHWGKTALELAGAIQLGAPLATHAENLMPNRVLAIADGVEGRAHPEWFTPGVVPITASFALRWAASVWSVETELRLPLLVRVSEADLPSATTSTRALALGAVASVEGRYRLSRRFSLTAATQLFFDIAPAVAHVRDVSPMQDLERFSLHVHLGSRAALVVDLQTAMAGALGGSMVAGGLRAAVNFR